MKKREKPKSRQKEIPEVLMEWLYLPEAGVTIQSLYQYLGEKEGVQAELWKEAGVLEIALSENGSMDLEILEEDQWDEELRSYIKEQQADEVYTVTFIEADQAKARTVMEYLTERTGGVFCRDTEDFLPEIKGR